MFCFLQVKIKKKKKINVPLKQNINKYLKKSIMPANIIATIDRRAAEDDKKKEVAFIRAEKAGDDTAMAKLIEKYGDGNKKNGDAVKKRIWTCHECQFRNVDTRDVCGKCLAPALAVLSLEKQQQSSNDLIPARGTLDPTTHVTVIGGRAYREFRLPELDAKKLNAKRAKIEQRRKDEEGENNLASSRGLQNRGASSGKRGGGGGDQDDDDDGEEDEPSCRPGAGGKKLGNREDGSDDGDSKDDNHDEDGDDDEEHEDHGEGDNHHDSYNDRKQEDFNDDLRNGYDYEREEEEYLMSQQKANFQDGVEDEDGIRYDKQRQVFSLKMKCASRFWKFIIGTKGKTLQDIQRISGATVLIPKEQQQQVATSSSKKNNNTTSSSSVSASPAEETIEIIGMAKSSIVAARLKVEAIMLDNQDRVEYTHFLSIPLSINPQSKAAFASYLQDMTRTCVDEEKRVDPFMFQTPSKIHLTLLMLRLHNQEEMNKAKSLLVVVQEMLREMFYSTASSSSTAKISFKGVNYMNDDPSDVHVLYLDLVRDETYKKLVDLIQKINSLFIDSGLALPKDVSHNEKLHATVVNSKWRGGDIMDGTLDHFEGRHTAQSGRKAPRVSFDATELLRLFGLNGNILGTHKLERVDLSVLGSGVGADGYYVSEHSAFFP